MDSTEVQSVLVERFGPGILDLVSKVNIQQDIAQEEAAQKEAAFMDAEASNCTTADVYEGGCFSGMSESGFLQAKLLRVTKITSALLPRTHILPLLKIFTITDSRSTLHFIEQNTL